MRQPARMETHAQAQHVPVCRVQGAALMSPLDALMADYRALSAIVNPDTLVRETQVRLPQRVFSPAPIRVEVVDAIRDIDRSVRHWVSLLPLCPLIPLMGTPQRLHWLAEAAMPVLDPFVAGRVETEAQEAHERALLVIEPPRLVTHVKGACPRCGMHLLLKRAGDSVSICGMPGCGWAA